jgi:hypothetical protein
LAVSESSITSGIIDTVAVNGQTASADGVQALHRSAWAAPRGLALDADGDVYLTDSLANLLRVIHFLGHSNEGVSRTSKLVTLLLFKLSGDDVCVPSP